MSFILSRQNQMQKKNKSVEKEEKIFEIRRGLDKEFENLQKIQKSKTFDKIDNRKLKLELNQIIFQNICKEKTLQDLRVQTGLLSIHKRSVSVNTCVFGAEKTQELKNEILEIENNIEREKKEAELLNRINIRERAKIRFLTEKVSILQLKTTDLEKFSEKMTRATFLAGNLYEASSKSLKSSRRLLKSQQFKRKLTLKTLRKKEILLANQVEAIKSRLSNRIYNDYEMQSKRSIFSSKLDTLLLSSRETGFETNSNLHYINSINSTHDTLIALIIKSKFIPEVQKGKISLFDIGECLNRLVFAEEQLQVRCSELINSQNLHRAKIEELQTEMKEIKKKFPDSLFIENWNHKVTAADVKILKFQGGKNNQVYIDQLENFSLALFRSLCTLQDHISKIVKKVNLMSIETQDKSTRTSSFMRKRTLSNRNSFSILPVIKDSNSEFSHFEFEQLVKSFCMEKFKTDPTIFKRFLKSLNEFGVLKRFLTAKDLAEYFSHTETAEEALEGYKNLFKPAHENMRQQSSTIMKFLSSFISGIYMVSLQILQDFENCSLDVAQLEKYLALFPEVKCEDENLRVVVWEVVQYLMKNHDKKTIKKDVKRVFNRKSSVGSHIDSPVMKDKEDVRVHRRTSTQREIKLQLDELSVKLVKSSKKL